MKISFIKCHGSGNDFIMINEVQQTLFENNNDRKKFVQVICDRNIIGADGVLFFGKSNIADFEMRIFNADGTEPEMCGNGIRCIGRLAHEVSEKDAFVIEVMGKKFAMKKETEIYPNVKTYSVKLEGVEFDVEKLPLVFEKNILQEETIAELTFQKKFSCIGMPNPHLVTFVNNDINLDELQTVGAKANHIKSIFPEGMNVSYCKPINQETLYTMTYERGVGITHSCGTAMSATSVMACVLGKSNFNEWISVLNKGGMVRCFVEKNKSINVTLLGNATYEYESSFNYTNGVMDSLQTNRIHTEEILAYKQFLESIT